MEELILGIKFGGHDSAIFAILPDTQTVFGMSSERLTRYKHDQLPPLDCFKKMGDYLQFDLKAVKKLRCSHSFLPTAENEFINFNKFALMMHERAFIGTQFISDHRAAREAFNKKSKFTKALRYLTNRSGRHIFYDHVLNAFGKKKKIRIDTYIKAELAKIFPNAEIDLSFSDHEFCHIVSSYFTSPQSSPLMISMDGHGDNNVYSRAYVIEEGRFQEIAFCQSPARFYNFSSPNKSVRTECSVGGLYTHFTEMLGFERNSDQGKVEALAAYGDPNNEVYDLLLESVFFSHNDGTIHINLDKAEQYFNYDAFQVLLQKYKKEDLAAAVQKFLEEVVFNYVAYLVEKTGIRQLAFSGGVFANVILNLKIFEELTPELFITPAMADDGSAQGAAINKMLECGWSISDLSWLKEGQMPYFGTSYNRDEVKKAIESYSAEYSISDLGDSWPEVAANLLCEGLVGAIFHGRMEWGPRALGNRSIIADARDPKASEILNKEIKRRPGFQPFCPSALAEEETRLFDRSYTNKHMTCAFRMKAEHHDALPSAIHIDGTARMQFVSQEDNPNYYRLLQEVKKISGYGIVLNTSFNKHGRTIVETPYDAIKDFIDTNMDYVIIEGFLLMRS